MQCFFKKSKQAGCPLSKNSTFSILTKFLMPSFKTLLESVKIFGQNAHLLKKIQQGKYILTKFKSTKHPSIIILPQHNWSNFHQKGF